MAELWIWKGISGRPIVQSGLAAKKALSEMLALKRYRGKPAMRNFRWGDGNVGVIRSPVRAIALFDLQLPALRVSLF
jgi:hypothetical protein